MYPKSFRSTLLLDAAFAGFIPTNASAQDELPAQGNSTAGEEQQTNDIIVTARRPSESAQDIPLAVSVIDAKQLDETGSFNVSRLQQLTPTLQFYSSNPRNTAVNIRGLGVPFGLTSDGFEQGVGVFIYDVYYSRVASATFDFLDVAQFEVLRGPQRTLYGKNTTAGAINITTNQPTFDFEGRAEVTLGNFDFHQARLSVSGPLSDTVAARLAASGTLMPNTSASLMRPARRPAHVGRVSLYHLLNLPIAQRGPPHAGPCLAPNRHRAVYRHRVCCTDDRRGAGYGVWRHHPDPVGERIGRAASNRIG